MEITEECVQSILRPLLVQLGLKHSSKVEVHPINARLWLSNAFKVKIFLDDEEKEKLSLFIKSLPTDILRKELFDSPAYFRNEVGFYNTVVTAFMEFQNERIKDNNDLFNAVPKCYTAVTNGENDLIVLEDVEANGFVMSSRLKLMSLPQLHLVMRELGRFHALSLAMKDQEPDRFNSVKIAVEETVFNDRFLGKIGKKMFTETCEDAVDMLKGSHPVDSPYVIKMERFLKSIIDVTKQQVHGDLRNEPFNVVTHGDMWVNNLMFKFGDVEFSEGDVLENLIFLDFQQSRYSSLALDVSSVLFMNMDKDMRDAHREALLRSYHDSLCELLRKLGSNPEKIFPFDCLENQLQKYSLYALANMIVNVPQAMDVYEAGVDEMELLGSLGQQSLSAEQIINIVVDELKKPYLRKTDQCKKRVLDVLEEAVNRGYLDNLPN